MILTATPGKTSAKIVIDADHPLVWTTSRTNLAPNPNFQYGSVAPATPSGAATLAVATAGGTSALRITPNGSALTSAAYPLGPITGTMARLGLQRGDTVTVSGYCILTAPQTAGSLDSAARRISVGFVRGSAQTFAEVVSSAAPNVAGSTRVSATFTIPADADDVVLRLNNGSNVAGDLVYWDGLLIERGSVVGSYFTGDTAGSARTVYAWSGTPGNSPSTLMLAHSPLEGGTPTPVQVSVGYGNMQGPYRTSDSDRMAQLPYQVSLVTSMSIDLFAAVELHEENEMHRLFLSRLQVVDPDWDLVEGDGGNQLLLRPSGYTATAKNNPLPGGRSMTDFTVTHLATGFQFHVLVTHFFADDDDGKSRDKEREAAAKFIAQYAVGLKYVIVAGDFNFQSDTVVKLRAILAGAGLLGLQTRQPGLAYGDRDSSSGSSSGRWIDDILTRQEQEVSGSAGVLAGQASDHYLWNRTTVSFIVASAAPRLKMTLTRVVDGREQPVPGVQGITAATTVVTDHTCPLNRDVVYRLATSDGNAYETPPVQLTADLPLLTHPVTGRNAPCVVQTWPQRSRVTPGTLITIPGRPSPVWLADVEALGPTAPVLLTRTSDERAALDTVLASGDVVLLRTLYPALPDAFLAVQSRDTGRVSDFNGTSQARLHTLTSQEIGAEDLVEGGLGDTLGDLAAAIPGGNLAELAALFPNGTLLDIAAADWRAGVAALPTTPTDPGSPTPDAVFPSPALFPSDTTYPGA